MNDFSENDLYGFWQLKEFSATYDNQLVIAPVGVSPIGHLIYTPDHIVSVQIMDPQRSVFAEASHLSASPEQAESAFKGYRAYWGKYVVDLNNKIVIHQVIGSLFPNEVGASLKRKVNLENGILTLTTDPILEGAQSRVSIIKWGKRNAIFK